ncbi:LytTR family DNA-binding domain-containing protein [Halosquirtibacter laminarini]|uniref:LytTR family DNA-binding domain-containing protein n=1 Tax=Halosquirtibacter laminarini TaxID=3374600 RepID=A0AC61NIZ7_9BACT|nr:LytTR family DNA-binding domain-containing protein [Prolixibacteraceae bacterium]
MKIQCLIVDDESLALDIIEQYIERIDTLQLVAKCQSAIEALDHLNNHKIDLLFLDIQMPGLTGIQLLRNISNPPPVIFTTAYSEYALESYDLEALDYLIKPIPFERFIKAINKYYKLKLPTRDSIRTPVQQEVKEKPFIFVKSDKRMVKIMLHEICYIESIRNTVSIYLTNKKVIITAMTISNIGEKLPEVEFLRVHRSFIVSISKIESYATANIKIENQWIPIGRNYKTEVLSVLQNHSIE